jgi:hypothetical protein
MYINIYRFNASNVIDVDGDDETKNSIAVKDEETLRALKGKIHDKLLNSLAPFQREGVLFVLNNKGRALIADEMGKHHHHDHHYHHDYHHHRDHHDHYHHYHHHHYHHHHQQVWVKHGLL